MNRSQEGISLAERYGIFAIELDFRPDRRQPSPLHSSLRDFADSTDGELSLIFRPCRSHKEFFVCLDLWARWCWRHPILILTGHRAPGAVSTCNPNEDDPAITLTDVRDFIRGRAAGRWVHIRSGETMDMPLAELRELKASLNLAGLSGYRRSVPRDDKLAFELAFLQQLTHACREAGAATAMERMMRGLCGGYCDEIGFTVI